MLIPKPMVTQYRNTVARKTATKHESAAIAPHENTMVMLVGHSFDGRYRYQ